MTAITASPTTVQTFSTSKNGTFLQLKGSKQNLTDDPKVIIQTGSDPVAALSTVPVGPTEVSGWFLKIANLPILQTTTKAFIAVRGEFGNGEHAYSPTFIVLSPQAVIEQLQAPTLQITKQASETTATTKLQTAKGSAGNDLYFTNTPKITATVTTADANANTVLLYVDSEPAPRAVALAGTGSKAFDVTLDAGRDHVLRAAVARGEVTSQPAPTAQADVKLRATGSSVPTISATGFGSGGGKETITAQVTGEDLDPATVTPANIKLSFKDGSANGAVKTATDTKYSPATKQMTITYDSKDIVPGEYTLTITNDVKDVFGNNLVGPQGLAAADPSTFTILAAVGDKGLPSVSVGVFQTGPSVPFAEYLSPRPLVEGFVPSDRVETRVVRLYYYRDAHRVAQLVNRTVKSYNAATVDVRRRAADRSRDDADKATDERKQLENTAVRAAQDARAAETDLKNLQNGLNTARGQLASAQIDNFDLQQKLTQANRDLAAASPGSAAAAAQQRNIDALQTEIAKRQQVMQTASASAQTTTDRIAAAQQAVATKREAEAKALEAWQVKELEERRRREGQFRAEVAAAKADPDTYGPGDVDSVDPVLRVSISVIGEGLIQLRGPIKGLNAIRTMVNQIDAPVGQVRVAVHTLQVNGERGDHMEKVIANIQRYLDHSRFLTAQSSQMLKNAVTAVAARKAAEVAATLAPGCTQWDRDQRYLYSFFGKDFTDELVQLDSEFLKTGNKLLSLNSMDSTSLSAALFLMALAKNDVRAEILTEFETTVQRDLPQAELKYYMAGLSQVKHCEACKDKKEYLLAYNSQFQSFIGFFNAQVTGNDTLTPLQREFVRLAQIFKARMITEMQLSQRVMERSLLEDRVGSNLIQQLRDALDLEKKAKAALRDAQDEANRTQAAVATQFQAFFEALTTIERGLDALSVPKVVEMFKGLSDAFDADSELKKQPAADRTLDSSAGLLPQTVPEKLNIFGKRALTYKIRKVLPLPRNGAAVKGEDETQFVLGPEWNAMLSPGARAIEKQLNNFVFFDAAAADAIRLQQLLARIKAPDSKDEIPFTLTELQEFGGLAENLIRSVSQASAVSRDEANYIVSQLLAGNDDAVRKALSSYANLKTRSLKVIRTGTDIAATARDVFGSIDAKVGALLQANAQLLAASRKAQQARRPLDEKRLLDILVDEMEDKFVEILEGTRAHTANIDNYMKSVATALDDDFNTQYYLPSFRRAREASRYWDVTLAQIETTSVLTNNRSLGKVSPAASFEFDLPKRNILITEGFKSAKALVDEYGALVNDPSFLALAKLSSGNPTSMMTGGAGGGLSAVRNVLPGLPSSADETIMAQAGPGKQQQFGAALEGLIPDPAIYKFETGTGYEIRPVLSPDGQSVVFDFDYLYTTDVREPVRADEKHLGRVRRHFVHTDVQLGNYELREVSKYLVSIKVARTGKGVQLLQDIPGVGILFRPLPSAGTSLQQNLIYSQATIFPTLFDLMGLRYAPAVADIDPLADRLADFAVRYRRLDIEQRMYDGTAARVDDTFRAPYGERRMDLYRPQVSIPYQHPNGYTGPGLRLKDGRLIEGYDPLQAYPDTPYSPGMTPGALPKPFNPNPQPYGPPGFDGPYGLPPQGSLPYPPLSPGGAQNRGGLPNYSAAPGGPGAPRYPQAPPAGPPPGSTSVGRSVPYTPTVGTTRPTELPGTYLPPVVTPGAPTISAPPPLTLLPGSPGSLPPVRPQPVTFPPPTVPIPGGER
ncbi:hypothetical protein [Frigoriglobus tundricola]|uniref:hypothetical protein n=1 Tax=Frigoriglobus tundricola TaxID=2774151 RepID=UPI00148EB027|nr:hypothetical protein [Frigoriglobus tundricola]